MKARTLEIERIEEFSSYLVNEEKSKNTIEKYIRDAKALLVHMDGREITKESIIEYKKMLTDKYALRSVNSIIAAVNCLFSFLGWQDLRLKPMKLQIQTYCSEEKELTKAEYMRLVSAAKGNGNHRLSLLIQTICATGIRVSEVEFITVESVKRGEAIVTLKGRTRSIFIIRKLQKSLLKYARDNNISEGPIFITRSGKPMSRMSIWREMKNICNQAKVKEHKVFPHNLRHLFARVFYSLEKDIAKLADILGHSSINTTRIYIITTRNEHKRQMENMRLIL